MTAMHTDGFANVVAGLGAANPKARGAGYYVMAADQVTVENAYRASTWFGKVIDIPADDATREWRSWQAEKDEIELLDAEEKRLDVRGKVRQALIWSRLYGGAVLLPVLPGDPAQEIRLDRIRRGDVKSLTVLHRWEISAEGRINDPFSPYYGEPERYAVTNGEGGQTYIHPSRVIRVNGRRVGSRTALGDGWGDSEWTHLEDAITASDEAASVVSALLREAKVDYVKVKGLNEAMATSKYEQAFMRRMTLANTLKSLTSAYIGDIEDEIDQKQISFSSIPDAVMLLLNIMSGAADIPVTRLLGSQSKGLSNGLEGDLKHYYDAVKTGQTLKIEPAIRSLDEMLIRSALGARPPSVWYSWAPLWQMSDKERAENERTYAEAADKLVNTGLVPESALSAAVQGRMLESGAWPGLEQGLEAAAVEPEPEEAGDPDDDPETEPGAAVPGSRETGDALTLGERDEIIDRVTRDPRKPVIERLWRYLTRGD